MRFGHKCIGATWSEQACKWHVKIQRLHDGTVFEDTADVFMTGVGALNNWRWPDIEGLKNFQGKLMHSAEWDTDYDLKVCLSERWYATATSIHGECRTKRSRLLAVAAPVSR